MLVLLVVAEARLSCSGNRSAKSVYSHANIFCRSLAGSKGQPGTLTEGTMALVLPGVDMPVVTTGDMTGSELVVAVTLRIVLGVAEKVGRPSAATDVVAGVTPSLAWGPKGEGLECMINAMGVAATVGVGQQQQQWGQGGHSSSGGGAATAAVGAGRPQQQWGQGGHSSSGGRAATAVGAGRPQPLWGQGDHSSSGGGVATAVGTERPQQQWGGGGGSHSCGGGAAVVVGVGRPQPQQLWGRGGHSSSSCGGRVATVQGQWPNCSTRG